ncbi:laccase, multicopper oxidase, benzenediol:oxygen oxidorectuctase [Rhizoctonia solani AG-1 IB]|uniref:Laccase, multicopper oxidase, benzenediol:oxygen oxidorectuctase n=1 Tax=Thanatephorus cucumeris (strain AG1-IB / isolate 7/3/14) TaxID=1108050 RepID=A0A0B7FTG3_THACB|nr:laccase, multicopper oxidase, benzenediol:oxygen oxidorectuctase [Rhizoctonia solani AG-1 IB]
MRITLATLTTFSLLTRPSLGAIVNYSLDIRNAVVSPDGFERSIVSANGLVPGTFIQANKGDTLHINVTNSLNDPTMRRATTIHWHGLFQAATADEDGPAFVTQCPISQNQSYTYEIPLGDQTGTFWYHAHLSSQYVDGLRGALVVYDPEDPQKDLYDVDNENTVIVLEDWYHTPAMRLEEQMFSTNNTDLLTPVPDSGLINGKGRYVDGPRVDRAVINVQPNRRYRFRVINTSAVAAFKFAIEGHRFTIIEADGIPHEPLVVDNFDIYAGQRYSIIVETNQTVANYWVSAPMDVFGAGTNPNLDTTNIYAVLRYEGAPDSEPTTEPLVPSGVALVEENLHALINPGAPGGDAPADVRVNLTIGRTTIDGQIAFTFNNIRYHAPSLPTLLAILANNATVDSDFGADEHTLTLPHNKVIELAITGGVNHPIHLHGHVFDVVQSVGGTLNYVNPPRRDVVLVSSPGVILRFRTDNPGPWFVHCHIDWHLEAGLALVFAEAPEEIRTGAQRVQPNNAWDQLCPKYQALPAELQ